MRELLISKVSEILSRRGFRIESFVHSNSCFDIMASCRGRTLLIKIFSNIDAFRPEQAFELKRIAAALNADAVVVGERTKAFEMEDGVCYERYEVPALTASTFASLLDEKTIEKKYFKGKEIVEIDYEKMKKRRVALGLSIEELAEKIGSSRESLYRYEKGESASSETAERLEKILGESVAKSINIFGKPLEKKDHIFDKDFKDNALSKMHELGFEMAVFEHAPFKAYSEPKSPLLIGRGIHRQELQKKAEELKKAKTIVKSDSVIVANISGKKKVGEVPVIEESELDSFSSAKDLLKEVKERGMK